jgi:hypothetical protein
LALITSCILHVPSAIYSTFPKRIKPLQNDKLQAEYKKDKKKLENYSLYGNSPLKMDRKDLGKIHPLKLRI